MKSNDNDLIGWIFIGLFASAFCVIGVGVSGAAAIGSYRGGFDEETFFGLFVGSMFYAFGLAVFYLAFASRHQEKLDTAIRKKWPKEPWKWQRQWREKAVADSNEYGYLFYAAFSVFWNVFSWGVLSIMYLKDEPLNLLLFVGIFGLIGILLIGITIREVILFHKWFGSRLELHEPVTGVGETFVGRLHLPIRIADDDRIVFTIACSGPTKEQQAAANSNPHHSQNEIETDTHIWSATSTASPHNPPGTTVSQIPISFEIPPGLEGTNEDRNFKWRVDAKSSKGLFPFGGTFSIPVFRLQPRTVTENTKRIAEAFGNLQQDWGLAQAVEEAGGRLVTNHEDHFEVEFPRIESSTNRVVVALGAIAMVICFGLITGVDNIFNRTAFCAVAAIAFGTVANAFTTNRLIANPGRLRRELFIGPLKLAKDFDWREIAHIDSSSVPTQPHYQSITLETNNGKIHQIAQSTKQDSPLSMITNRLKEYQKLFAGNIAT